MGGGAIPRLRLIFIAVLPHLNANSAYLVFCKANRILNKNLLVPFPFTERQRAVNQGGQQNTSLALLRCRAPLSTYKQCTTVRPSPPLYSSCHLSTWRMSFKKERLDTGVSLYMGQPRNWNCCTTRYPSWGWRESGSNQGVERKQALFTGGILAG